jgi:MscS family membrane protein
MNFRNAIVGLMPLSLWAQNASQVPDSLEAQKWIKQYGAIQGDALGLSYTQWLALVFILVLGLMVKVLVRFLAPPLSKPIQKWFIPKDKSDHKIILSKSFSSTAMAATWLIALNYSDFPASLTLTLIVASKTLLTLSLIWFLWKTVDYLSETLRAKADATQTKFDDLLIPFIRTGLRIFVLLVGMVLGAEILHLPLKSIVAGLGIGSLAFALAAKDTIENLFGSVTVLLDRPFHIGDWVVIDGVEGTVEKLGFRSTRIRTFYNSQVTLPNSTLINAVVDNMGEREYRRIKTNIGISYNTPTEHVDLFCQGIRDIVLQHPYTRKDYFQVYLNQFGPSSLDILLYIFVKVPDWSTELREKERLFLDIMNLAQSMNIEFAYPTQTLYMNPDQPAKIHMDKLKVDSLVQKLTAKHYTKGNPPPPVKL